MLVNRISLRKMENSYQLTTPAIKHNKESREVLSQTRQTTNKNNMAMHIKNLMSNKEDCVNKKYN